MTEFPVNTTGAGLRALAELSDAIDQVEAALRESRPPVLTPQVTSRLAAAGAAVDRATTVMSSLPPLTGSEALRHLERRDLVQAQMDVVRCLIEKADR